MLNLGANSYEEKLGRIIKSAKLEKVDRVPIGVADLYFPAKYSNFTNEEIYYDHEKFTASATKFAKDFDWDAVSFLRTLETVGLGLSLAATDATTAINVAVTSVLMGGFSHDILKDNYSSLPGRELAATGEGQFKIKKPLMNDDEYDEMLADPFGFLTGKVVPRAYNALSNPGSGEAMSALINFGMQLGAGFGNVVKFYTQDMKTICPPWYLGLMPNPLDTLGPFFRDFDKLMLDIHRVPDKIKQICDILMPVLIAVGKTTGTISYQLTGSRIVFCPVFYNSFLSKREYREFLWPYLKNMIEELIKDDFIPLLSLQGTYDHLLDTLLELPAGKAIAWFDRTDPVKAKAVLGDHMCIAGGIPAALVIGGTPAEIDEQVKKLLEEMKKAKGFIFTMPFNALGPANVENVVAMTEAVRKYGVY